MSRAYEVARMRAWYNPDQAEQVLVVRTRCFAGVRVNLRTRIGVAVYDASVKPLANYVTQGIYEMHLADRFGPAAYPA